MQRTQLGAVATSAAPSWRCVKTLETNGIAGPRVGPFRNVHFDDLNLGM